MILLKTDHMWFNMKEMFYVPMKERKMVFINMKLIKFITSDTWYDEWSIRCPFKICSIIL